MPNRVIEIHDSVLESLSLTADEIHLHFSSVCIHQSDGDPGLDAGSVWLQRALIRIAHPQVLGTFSKFPVRLSEGRISLAMGSFANEIPIPLRFEGAVALTLEAFEFVTIKGDGATLELLGEATYLEEFRP
jgi:hypothetical protein